MKWILSLIATLFIWTPLSFAKSVSLVDCAKVRCLTPEDEQKAQRLQEQKLAQHTVAQNLSSKSSKSKSSSENGSTAARGVLNKDAMTLQEQQTYFARNPWSFVLSAGLYRTLDEISDYYSSYAVSGNYQLNRDMFVNFGLGYDTIFYSPHDDSFLFNHESSNPRLFGLTDLRVGLSLPGYKRFDEINSILTLSTRLTLPTSMRSRDKSMMASLITTAQLRSRLTPKLMSSVSGSLALAHFKYDDGDKMGYEVNSPLGAILGLGLSYNVWKKLTAYSSFSMHARYDYDSNLDWIQTVSAGLLLPVSQKMQLNFDFMWRDRVITNDRLFQDYKSYYNLGLSYSI